MATETAVLETQKKYASRALMLCIGAGLLFLAIGHTAICRGVVLGGVFSAVNFTLMGQLLRYRLGDNRHANALRSFLSLLLRYLLLAVPLILAVQSERFSFPATAVGIFAVQLVIMIEHGSRLISTSVKH